MRFFKLSISNLMILIAISGLNLAGAVAVLKQPPRFQGFPFLLGSGNGRSTTVDYGDGSTGYYKGSYTGYYKGSYRKQPTKEHLLRPPDPTALRVWSPVIASVTASFLILIPASTLARRFLTTTRRRVLVSAAVALLLWLTVPALRILCDPKGGFYDVPCGESPGRKCFYATPYWPQYWRLLVGAMVASGAEREPVRECQ